MTGVQQLLRCTCGQMNRVYPNSHKAGDFKCGKCGRMILAVPGFVSGQRARSNASRVFIVLALILGSVAVIKAISANPNPAREAQLSVSRPHPASGPPPPQTISTSVRPASVLPEPRPVEPIRLPPVLDLTLPDAVQQSATRVDNGPRPAPQTSRTELSAPAPIDTRSPAKLDPPIEAQRQPMPTPRTGDLQPRRRANAIAPFNVVTEAGSNYLIKLVNARNAKDQIWIFIKGGEPYSTKVPIGSYKLRVASGDTWYGRQDLFGPRTRLFRLRNKNGTALDENQLLQFRKERNRVFGMTLNFKGSRDGNLEQEAMSRAEFDSN